jgi:hypothetical protein
VVSTVDGSLLNERTAKKEGKEDLVRIIKTVDCGLQVCDSWHTRLQSTFHALKTSNFI